MKNIVLFGGNGYIGQEVVKLWLKKDNQTQFFIISRSGNSSIKDTRIHDISADVTDENLILKGLPDSIDYIVNFIGRPEKNINDLKKINENPVNNMIKLAEKYNVTSLGFIGGVLGPKLFVNIKSELIKKLQNTGKNIVYVEPTIVYGGNRNDILAKFIPIFKIFGIFLKNMKPVKVDEVANDLIQKLTTK